MVKILILAVGSLLMSRFSLVAQSDTTVAAREIQPVKAYCPAYLGVEVTYPTPIIQVTASIYPSWMLNHNVQNNYVAGHFTLYFHKRYSFRGEIQGYVDAQGEQKYISKHVQVQTGFGRHFQVKRWDPYVYATMGLSSIRLQSHSRNVMQPSVGLIAGTSFHVSRYFYFFAECLYQHMQNPSRDANLDQLFISGGLGFQLSKRE